MAAGSIIGTQNRIVSGTLSAGSAATPVSNLATPFAGQAWTTAGSVTTPAGGAYLVCDSGNSATVWQAFGLFATNLSASSVVTWLVGPNSSGASPVYSATTTAQCDPNYRQVLHIAPNPVTGRYLRIEITDSAATGGYVSVGLAYAGPLLRPAINQDYSSSYGSMGGETISTTRGGIEHVTPSWQARMATANYSGLTEAESDVLFDLDGEARAGANFLFVPETTSINLHREAVYGRMQMPSTLGYAGQGDTARTAKLVFTERVG